MHRITLRAPRESTFSAACWAPKYRGGARGIRTASQVVPTVGASKSYQRATKQKSNHLAPNGLAFRGKSSIAVATGGR
jgi:hypothetical protein